MVTSITNTIFLRVTNFSARIVVNRKILHGLVYIVILGFKQFLCFDYAGNSPWPLSDVVALLLKPLVTTFESPGSASDWPTIKSQIGGFFFIPDWSSLGAKAALELHLQKL
ncbi:hypothetical protein V1525DRAFT_408582 [Lipomyces kononenkoae]|uniref:Uncharacterized protein n=1 Tax=Lipomyces kononenkoae TaxID=34357 RepID=A0ACC3SW86_LIPKO